MRFLLASLFLITTIGGGVVRADAGSGKGSSAVPFLRIAPTARPIGLGGAFTGVAEGVDALGYNPAGLTTIDRATVSLTHNEMVLGVDYDYAAVAYRFAPRTVAGLSFTSLGAKETRRNSAGAITGSFRNSDIAGALTVSHSLTDILALGITGRLLRSKLDDLSASGVGFDAGIRYRMPGLPGLTLGAAVHNLGTDIHYNSVNLPQPWTIRGGASWRGYRERVMVAGDIEWDREGQMIFHTGIEGRTQGGLFGRLGATLHQDADIRQVLRAGLGVATSVGDFDYAYESYGTQLGSNHRLTYAYLWGRERPEEERPVVRRGIFRQSEEPSRPGPREENRPTDHSREDVRISVAVGEFTNLTPDPGLDWVEPSLVAISERLLDRSPVLRRVAKDADFRIDGRFARSGERVEGTESLWVSIRLYNGRGAVIETRDGLVLEPDLIRGTETLVGEILSKGPQRTSRPGMLGIGRWR